ncbi:hypothetical protein FACS1894106_2860 [Spirochaetia bacterium]|nr:hypothetical protein FACS1894106_2860 [Spirochaetia bacterium]
MTNSKRRTISFTVDPEEFEEILLYAKAKGHGGQFPTSTFAHFAVFQTMRKTALSAAERARYMKCDGNENKTS